MGASLIIGDGNWGTKPNKTLGYKPTTKGFTPKEGDHERASIGSYTDRNGVLQTGRVTNYGGNILLNANFAPEELGTQLLLNSTFAASLGWSEGAGWTIAGGQASGSGSAGAISQALDVVEGQAYKLIVDITSMTGVGIYINVDGQNLASLSDTDIGVQSVYFVATETKTINVSVACVGGADTAVLDSFGVQETNSNWISNSDSIIFDDFQLEFDATPSNRRLYQDTGEPKIQNVRVKFNILTYTDGGVVIEYGGFTSEVFNTLGEHEVTFTTDGVEDTFSINTDIGSASTTLTINSVELQELTETDENVDELRIDFSEDPNGVMLLEDAANNLIAYSEDLTNVYWSLNSGVTVAANGIASCSKSINSFKITESENNEAHVIGKVGAGITDAFQGQSIIVKKGTSNFIQTTSSRNPANYVNFDLENKTFKEFGTSEAEIIELLDDWLWLRVYHDSSQIVYWHLVESLNSGWSPSYLGTGKYLFVCAPQVEAGKPTSYIPTNGTTRLREADKATNFGTVDDFNSEEGVLVVNIAALSNDGTFREISISDGTSANSIRVFYTSSDNAIQYNYTNNGETQSSLFDNTNDVTNFNEFVFTWKENDFNLYVNGVLKKSDNLGNTIAPNVFNTLDFANPNTSLVEFFGKTKHVKVYKSVSSAKLDYPYIQ